MKRTLSFALIALLLFNTIGYYAFFLGLQFHNDWRLTKALDDENEVLSTTISMKIPFTVPYSTDSREYVRVDGVVEYQGEFLHLVKQRLYKDTLEIICVKDSQRKGIHQAFIKYAGSLNDNAGTGQHSKVIQPLKEFLATVITISPAAQGWTIQLYPSKHNDVLNSPYFSSPLQPPEQT